MQRPSASRRGHASGAGRRDGRRKVARGAGAATALLPGWRCALALLLFASCRREVPVLLYHEVGCDTQDARDVPAAELDRQLSWLDAHGFRYVTAREAILGGPGLPVRPIAITFDDGAACLFSAAFPVLQRHRAPFELFLPSGWVTTDPAARHPLKLEDGEQVRGLVWSEVAAMTASGLASVGAHGREHRYLRRADPATLESEIAGSRADVAVATGAPVDLFAYPFGSFNGVAIAAVRGAGYAGAVSVSVGLGGTFAYRRRSVHRGLTDRAFEALLGDRWILPVLNHD